jgi:hypothetical protein
VKGERRINRANLHEQKLFLGSSGMARRAGEVGELRIDVEKRVAVGELPEL